MFRRGDAGVSAAQLILLLVMLTQVARSTPLKDQVDVGLHGEGVKHPKQVRVCIYMHMQHAINLPEIVVPTKAMQDSSPIYNASDIFHDVTRYNTQSKKHVHSKVRTKTRTQTHVQLIEFRHANKGVHQHRQVNTCNAREGARNKTTSNLQSWGIPSTQRDTHC